MPGTFTERQEGQCCWREVGKGAGRLDGVSGAAGDMVCRIWHPTLGALALTLSEMGSTEDFEQRRKMTSVKRIPLAVP